jgi:hypothetical protein
LGTGEFANVCWVECFVSGGTWAGAGARRPRHCRQDAGATGCGGTGCERALVNLERESKSPPCLAQNATRVGCPRVQLISRELLRAQRLGSEMNSICCRLARSVSRAAKRCLRFGFFATTFVAAVVTGHVHLCSHAYGSSSYRPIQDCDCSLGYEILNGVENDSCAGIEVASAALLRALRATSDEGVRSYIFVGNGKSKSPPCLAKSARQGWGTLTSRCISANWLCSSLLCWRTSGWRNRGGRL